MTNVEVNEVRRNRERKKKGQTKRVKKKCQKKPKVKKSRTRAGANETRIERKRPIHRSMGRRLGKD
jgi:hypothetical protein